MKNTDCCSQRTQMCSTDLCSPESWPLIEHEHLIMRSATYPSPQNDLFLFSAPPREGQPPCANVRSVHPDCTASKHHGLVILGLVHCQVLPPFQFAFFLSYIRSSTKEWSEPFLIDVHMSVLKTLLRNKRLSVFQDDKHSKILFSSFLYR